MIREIEIRAELAYIPLTRGKTAIIDAMDVPLVWGFWQAFRTDGNDKWYAHSKQRNVYLHRLLMPPPLGFITDHKNRDGLDCRRSNLRFATRAQNSQNKAHPRTASVFKGVSKKAGRRWSALITVNKKKIHLGHFDTAEEAARAYDAAAIEYFKEFAALNFPDL
jgi:hypothetical protein